MSIRPAKVEDLPQMLEIYRPFVEHTAVSFEYQVPSPENFFNVFGTMLPNSLAGVGRKRPCFRVCLCRSSLGSGRPTAGVQRAPSIWPPKRREGASEKHCIRLWKKFSAGGAMSCSMRWSRQKTNLLAFHQAMGFRRRAVFPDCGYKFGRWHGVIWLEKRLSDLEHPSAFPCAWDEKETI